MENREGVPPKKRSRASKKSAISVPAVTREEAVSLNPGNPTTAMPTSLDTLVQAVEAAWALDNDSSGKHPLAGDKESSANSKHDAQPKPKRKRTAKPKGPPMEGGKKSGGSISAAKKMKLPAAPTATATTTTAPPPLQPAPPQPMQLLSPAQSAQTVQAVPIAPAPAPATQTSGTVAFVSINPETSTTASSIVVNHGMMSHGVAPARFAIAAGPNGLPIAIGPHTQFFAAPHPFYGAATVAMPTPITAVNAQPQPPATEAQQQQQQQQQRQYHDTLPVMPGASILFQGKKKASERDGASELDRILEIISQRDDDGDTCLHLAVVHGNIPITRQLLETMVTTRTNVDPRNNLYQTPLHIAVVTGETQIVKDLLLAGADVNLQDRCGRTAAHLCCIYHSREALKLLGTTQEESIAQRFGMTLHKLDTSIMDYEGNAPVHCSVINNDGQALNILLEHGADIDEKDGTAGRTPLHHAVELQNLPITRYLVDAGANVNAVNYAGNSPLHTAAGREHRDLVNILMTGGADPTMVNGEGDTAKDICRDKEIKRLMNR